MSDILARIQALEAEVQGSSGSTHDAAWQQNGSGQWVLGPSAQVSNGQASATFLTPATLVSGASGPVSLTSLTLPGVPAPASMVQLAVRGQLSSAAGTWQYVRIRATQNGSDYPAWAATWNASAGSPPPSSLTVGWFPCSNGQVWYSADSAIQSLEIQLYGWA